MSSKKDLVEAYSFSRRRLVTAFVSGAPGGREVEPARPGRAVIGGLALAVLLLAGAAILGVFKGFNQVDLTAVGLYSDDRGTLYVVLEEDLPGVDGPRMRQVVNATSARLILGSDAEVQKASADEIDDQRKGPAIGIVDAPSTVPAAGKLANSDWTACTHSDNGVRIAVGAGGTATPAPDARFLVRVGKERFLIAMSPPGADGAARAYSYRVPSGPDNIYTALDLGSADDAVEVPERWLSLLPAGGDLTSARVGLSGLGDPISDELVAAGYPRSARNGDYFESNGVPVVFTRDGTQRISRFALAVLTSTSKGAPPSEIDVPAGVDLDLAGEVATDNHWPTDPPAGPRPASFDSVCLTLKTAADARPVAVPAIAPEGAADPVSVTDGTDAQVEPGSGAVVRSGDWGASSGGTPYLIDDRGIGYRLGGQLEVDNLGYGDVPPVVVPDSWLELFGVGVELTQEAALCPPRTSGPASCG